MKIDAEIMTGDLTEIPTLASKAGAYGFDCFWANETKHDPFVQLSLASTSARSMSLGSSIALAFTRSPTTIAYAAWDLQNVTGGRFILGLGSQVKGHIERRFGLKWESPGPKMREVVLALRSIWNCWQKGEKMDFHGRFFSIDLMTPFFNPGPISKPEIPIFIAGVNRGMYRLAGEVAQGLHVHPLHTVGYLRDFMIPELSKGLATSKRSRRDFSVAASVFAAVGDDESQIRNVKEAYRSQIAFYASTRTYRALMEFHGWGDVCDRLHELSMRGAWDKMGGEISDEMMDEFVVEGTWSEIGERIKKKYGDTIDRARLYLPFDGSPSWKAVADGFRN
ncbi:MAG TPA: TIGR03617 family F420-dependent LLM class oxidoreductase [Nitrososphaerales archaeon]|nr:TIGR03617 family F420-dependent LLM class oxidoreductase [Nitrososphaerales archaeon]